MSKNKCSYLFTDDFANNSICNKEIYKDHDFCLFHSPYVEDKKEDFIREIFRLTDQYRLNPNHQYFDYTGFIFPDIKFENEVFGKPAVFMDCKFNGSIHFKNTVFKSTANFGHCHFNGSVILENSIFENITHISESKFKEPMFCRGLQFKNKIFFNLCKFMQDAHFEKTIFDNEVYFSLSNFDQLANFLHCQFNQASTFNSINFNGLADFRKTIFKDKADFTHGEFLQGLLMQDAEILDVLDFTGSYFAEPVILSDSYINYLVKLQSPCAVFKNSVIKNADLSNIKTIKEYFFINTVLLSIIFDNSLLLDCDFTGAVIEKISNNNWEVDLKTIENTKYFFTQSYKSMVLEDPFSEKTHYLPLDQSRVPLTGTLGDKENSHLNFVNFFTKQSG